MTRFWVDNTGCHSAGRALSGRAIGEIDVDGLLQMANLLVFADGLAACGFERPDVVQRTLECRARLISLGLPEKDFQILATTTTEYERACVAAADYSTAGLREAFHPAHGNVLGIQPELGVAARLSAGEFVREALQGAGHVAPRHMRTMLREGRAPVALLYMVIKSMPFRRAVIKAVNAHRNWTDAQTEQLQSFVRFYLNQSLAETHSYSYAPAVARGRLMRMQRDSLITRLGDHLKQVAAKVTSPVQLSPVLSLILERSRGSPLGVIREALKLRLRAGAIRKELSVMIADLRADSGSGRVRAERRFREVVEIVEMELGIRPAPRLADAIDVYFVFGIPAPGVSGVKLCRWVVHRWRARRLAVITEASAAAAGYRDLAAYNELRRASARYAWSRSVVSTGGGTSPQ